MTLYPPGHAPYVPVKWIADIAHCPAQNETLYTVCGTRNVAEYFLEVLRAAIFRSKQVAGTEPLPEQQDGISRLPEDIRRMLQTLKATQQCCEEWLESETCLAILAKYPQPPSPSTSL
jgi:hypothetical protein